VQRLFSMFPRGAPGFALLLFRASVGTSVLLGAGSAPHCGVWMLAMTLTLSILLCVGLLTPIAALLTIPVYLADTASLRIAPTAVVIPIVQAIALSLLGPGSCSIDAHLYGRRVVVLPQKSDRDTG
jgi:putative oxidoreductase